MAVDVYGFTIPIADHLHLGWRTKDLVRQNQARKRHPTIRSSLPNPLGVGGISPCVAAGTSRLSSLYGTLLLSFGSPSSDESLPLPFIGIALLGAVGLFAYANWVLTPEIMEGASLIRQENRNAEIRKLIVAVESHINSGNPLSELRVPLEAALGTSLEEYIETVNEVLPSDNSDAGTSAKLPLGDGDLELAAVIRSALATEH